MKRLLAVLFLLTAALAFGQQKFALVIGNGNYTGSWNSLANPVNDAIDMDAALKELGFQVELLRNATRLQMRNAVVNYCKRLNLTKSAYGFFYYAGHGAQDRNGNNYLIPVNADTESLNQLPDEALSVRFILEEIEDAKNELNLIVLDACRNMPKSLDRDDNRGLAPISKAPIGSIIMFATAAGKTASDGGSGRNGLFTSHLLKNLRTPGLDVNEVFRRTGSDVSRATNGNQYPETQYKYFEIAYLGSRIEPPSNMVRINGGTFLMGSPSNEPGRGGDELQHQVTVSSFYMGKYEVTQAEYESVMGKNPSNYKRSNHPVTFVWWYDAVEYCNKLSQMEGLTPAYSGSGDNISCNWNANGYRLPTEAEWEYACRAGTTTPFSTGNNITTSQANYNSQYNNNTTGIEITTPVGSFAPNHWGLHDMHGNVWEWCWDWYGDYSSGAQTNPRGQVSGARRVIRGGSFFNNESQYLRSASRGRDHPGNGFDFRGFRVVRN
jgi:formylglycine-generating enzyme required for sulfatase activity